MKVLTVSRFFPAYHPRAGQPTEFVEKILMGLIHSKLMMKSKASEVIREVGCPETHPMYYIDGIYSYDCPLLKLHTIRAGNRWKEREMVSLRVWSDKPYRSKQIEFAQVEVKKTWDFEITYGEYYLDGEELDYGFLQMVARNDGLSMDDLEAWFAIHAKKKGEKFSGQIICWGDVDYTGLHAVSQ